MSGDFKNLIAWQKSMDLAMNVYSITSSFPTTELYGLTNQLRRAAVSIPSNIAEGHGRWTSAELVRSLRIANGSRQEVETQLLLAERFGYVCQEPLIDTLSLLDEVGKIIFGLIRARTES